MIFIYQIKYNISEVGNVSVIFWSASKPFIIFVFPFISKNDRVYIHRHKFTLAIVYIYPFRGKITQRQFYTWSPICMYVCLIIRPFKYSWRFYLETRFQTSRIFLSCYMWTFWVWDAFSSSRYLYTPINNVHIWNSLHVTLELKIWISCNFLKSFMWTWFILLCIFRLICIAHQLPVYCVLISSYT